MAFQFQITPFRFDSLYCEEEHCDINGAALLPQSEEDVISLVEHDFSLEDEEVSFLLNKEQENEPCSGLGEEIPSWAKARDEAVVWMLKVIGYYCFSAHTAVLAVNYLDRFLYGFQTNIDKPWMIQLAAVSCLSLAAKVEETHVPLLLDLQVEECKYVFESKTIQRMEILIMSTLKWKMNPVTPVSFLECISRRLGFKNHLCAEILRRCEFLLLSLVSDRRFTSCPPSAMATATMLYVFGSLQPRIGVHYQDKLVGILGIDKNKVEECCGLIQEVATSVHFVSCNKRKFGSMPGSPKGVVDVCFSSNSSYDSSILNPSACVSSSPEPLSKKIKSQSSINNSTIF